RSALSCPVCVIFRVRYSRLIHVSPSFLPFRCCLPSLISYARPQSFLCHALFCVLVADIVSNPLWLVFYIVGILATVYHFANGLWSFMITWGITQSDKAQKYMGYASLLVFVVVSVIGIQAILAFIYLEQCKSW